MTVKVFWDEVAWVAQAIDAGGPNVCAQGPTPWEAMRRFAGTLMLDAELHGGIDGIPRVPDDVAERLAAR